MNYKLISKNNIKRSSGQSLFEVVFAIGIAALVLVGALSLSTSSVRNSTFSKNDSVATKYAQEGIEWIREQRDINWTNLSSRTGGTRCISSPPAWGASVASCASCSIGNSFSRCVQLTATSVGQIDAVINVQWVDGQGTHSVTSATTYTRWH